MSFTTVYVDVTAKPAQEIARDARDPFEHTQDVEHVARVYSLCGKGRTVRVWPDGSYTPGWRKRPAKDALYECYDGKPTEEYR